MSKLKAALFLYSFLLSIIVLLGGVSSQSLVPIFIFLPVTFYFLFSLLIKLGLINKKGNFVSRLVIYYSFVITSIMTVTGLLSAKNSPQLISAVLFLPITIYFAAKVIPRRNKAILIPQIVILPKEKSVEDIFELQKTKAKKLDVNRRQFIKLIGSAGLTLFLFSIFTKKAHASFFGSVPGPGTVAIKDTTGTQIDPAIKHPTDGYRITQMDETSDSPNTYYGYVNKDGAWFVMKDDGSGNYRYTKNTSDFTNVTTGWPNRASLTYDYFDAIF